MSDFGMAGARRFHLVLRCTCYGLVDGIVRIWTPECPSVFHGLPFACASAQRGMSPMKEPPSSNARRRDPRKWQANGDLARADEVTE